MIMSREDVFMGMMEQKLNIALLKGRTLILKLHILLIIRIVLQKDGDKFLSFFTLEIILIGLIINAI